MSPFAAAGLLPVRTAGPANGHPVILLHGFLADSRQWRQLTRRVDALTSRRVRWLMPDLPGHGKSATLFPAQPGWAALVDLLARSLQPHLQRPALLGGYSMGGRVAGALADAKRLDLAGLWLESAHPPLSPTAAQSRRAEDAERARRLEADGLAAFVRDWENLPLFASQRRLPGRVQVAQRHMRLGQSPEGLAQSLRWYGTGTMPAHLQIPLPTRVLVGALDLNLLGRVALWQALAADVELTTSADAGHAVHLEQPFEAARHLAATLDAVFAVQTP